jgi:V/A-type H+-transporting ATPase subunit B
MAWPSTRLPAIDQSYLDLGDRFEDTVVQHTGRRSLENSMAAGWEALRQLPHSELHWLTGQQIERYLPQPSSEAAGRN